MSVGVFLRMGFMELGILLRVGFMGLGYPMLDWVFLNRVGILELCKSLGTGYLQELVFWTGYLIESGYYRTGYFTESWSYGTA